MKFYENLVVLSCQQLAEFFAAPLRFHTSLQSFPGGFTSFATGSYKGKMSLLEVLRAVRKRTAATLEQNKIK